MKMTRYLTKVMAIAVLIVAFPSTNRVSHAGMIFTTRAAYDAAVLGLNLSWSEDFEGFTPGPVPVPTIIGGGFAEIALSGPAQIITSMAPLPPSGGNFWLGATGGIGEKIQGLVGTSLGMSAIGFDYFSELGGWYNFNHSGGVDSDVLMPNVTPLFVGWVGSVGEVLDFVDYTPGTSAHVLNDIVAHTVPEPSTLGLVSLGLLSLGMLWRRGK